MNTTIKKGLEVSKSNADSLASIIANALGIVLRHEAHQSKDGRWFIINLDSDDVVDMLAGFMCLPYNDFVLLFQEAGLFELQASWTRFNIASMIAIITDIDSDLIKVTQSKVTLNLIPTKKYYAIHQRPEQCRFCTIS